MELGPGPEALHSYKRKQRITVHLRENNRDRYLVHNSRTKDCFPFKLPENLSKEYLLPPGRQQHLTNFKAYLSKTLRRKQPPKCDLAHLSPRNGSLAVGNGLPMVRKWERTCANTSVHQPRDALRLNACAAASKKPQSVHPGRDPDPFCCENHRSQGCRNLPLASSLRRRYSLRRRHGW